MRSPGHCLSPVSRMGHLLANVCLLVLLCSYGETQDNDVEEDRPGVPCRKPANIEHTEIVQDYYWYTDDDVYENGTIVEYRCMHGTIPNISEPLELTCHEGTWSEIDFRCEVPAERNCTNPPAVTDARLAAANSRAIYYSGSSIMYECKLGMYARGGSRRIECHDGQWSETTFECIWGSCPYLKPLKNGRRLDDKNLPGEATYFECNPGYEMRGRKRLLCRTDWKWLPRKPPTCTPVRCPIIRNIADGSIFPSSVVGTRPVFETVLRYSCHRDFVLKGPTRRRCNEQGVWDREEPTCYLQRCPEIHVPLYNGQIEYSDDRRTVNSSAFFICDEHSDLHPNDVFDALCLQNEQWNMRVEDFPLCLRWAPVPGVDNGFVYDNRNWNRKLQRDVQIEHNKSVFITCNKYHEEYRDGLFLNRTPERVSTNKNGTWEPSIAKCVPKRCDLDQVISNKHVVNTQDGNAVGGLILHDHKVLVSCVDNYELDLDNLRQEVPRRCEFGKIDIPVCIPRRCPIPDKKKYPHLRFRSSYGYPETYDHDETATASCRPRTHHEVYNNKTNEYIETYSPRCEYGSWSEIYPCVEKHCDLPTDQGLLYLDIENEETIQADVDIASGTSVMMSCLNGYRMYVDGNKAMRSDSQDNGCSKGYWGHTVTCKPLDCQRPDVMYGSVLDSHRKQSNEIIGHEHKVMIVCREGFRVNFESNHFEGQFGMMCHLGKLTNRWLNETLPQCLPKKCDLKIMDGTKYYDNDRLFEEGTEVSNGTRITVRCLDDYQRVDREGHLTTLTTSTCILGKWPTPIYCHRIQCNIGDLPMEMMSNEKTVPSGEQVTLFCKEGYEILDNGKRSQHLKVPCRGLRFNGTLPKCAEVGCRLEKDPNGVYEPDSEEVTSGSNVRMSCASEFKLKNSISGKYVSGDHAWITCVRGSFEHTFTCEAKRCRIPDEKEYPHLTFNVGNDHTQTFDHGTTATASCEPRNQYEVYNNATNEYTRTYSSKCEYEQWSKIYPCVEKRCPLHKDPNGVYEPDIEMVSSGSKVNVSCTDGFELKKSKGKYLSSHHANMRCERGSFKHTFKCAAQRCRRPEEGNIILTRWNGELFTHEFIQPGKKMKIKCPEGHKLNAGKGVIVCNNGKWDPKMPVCLPKQSVPTPTSQVLEENRSSSPTSGKPVDVTHGQTSDATSLSNVTSMSPKSTSNQSLHPSSTTIGTDTTAVHDSSAGSSHVTTRVTEEPADTTAVHDSSAASSHVTPRVTEVPADTTTVHKSSAASSHVTPRVTEVPADTTAVHDSSAASSHVTPRVTEVPADTTAVHDSSAASSHVTPRVTEVPAETTAVHDSSAASSHVTPRVTEVPADTTAVHDSSAASSHVTPRVTEVPADTTAVHDSSAASSHMTTRVTEEPVDTTTVHDSSAASSHVTPRVTEVPADTTAVHDSSAASSHVTPRVTEVPADTTAVHDSSAASSHVTPRVTEVPADTTAVHDSSAASSHVTPRVTEVPADTTAVHDSSAASSHMTTRVTEEPADTTTVHDSSAASSHVTPRVTEVPADTTAVHKSSAVRSDVTSRVTEAQKQEDPPTGGCLLPEQFQGSNGEDMYKSGDLIPVGTRIAAVCEFDLYGEQNVTCMENGKFNEDLTPCTGDVSDCPELKDGFVKSDPLGYYKLICKDGYTLNDSDCFFTKCSNQKFECGQLSCEPAHCTMPRRQASEPFPKISKTRGGPVKHDATITVTCKEGFEPAVVQYTCMFGKFHSNNADFKIEDGYLLQCQQATCERCVHGRCVRNNMCDCNRGYSGDECDIARCPTTCETNGGVCTKPDVCECPNGRAGSNCETVRCPTTCEKNGGSCTKPDVCECPDGRSGSNCEIVRCGPACKANGGSCTKPDVCGCPFMKTGRNCEFVEYRVNMKISSRTFSGTVQDVDLTVTGQTGSFTQKLEQDLDMINEFSSGKKLRFRLYGTDVGEIQSVKITLGFLNWNVGIDNLSLEYLSMHSFAQKFYRFEKTTGELTMRKTRQCTFETKKNSYASDIGELELGKTRSPTECQLRCAEHSQCKVATRDYRNHDTHYCRGFTTLPRIVQGNASIKWEIYSTVC